MPHITEQLYIILFLDFVLSFLAAGTAVSIYYHITVCLHHNLICLLCITLFITLAILSVIICEITHKKKK